MGHAKEIVRNIENPVKFDCIVCCSGDGIINEVKACVCYRQQLRYVR